MNPAHYFKEYRHGMGFSNKSDAKTFLSGMEGQSVFQIDQNYFKWRLLDPAPSLAELELDIK